MTRAFVNALDADPSFLLGPCVKGLHLAGKMQSIDYFSNSSFMFLLFPFVRCFHSTKDHLAPYQLP